MISFLMFKYCPFIAQVKFFSEELEKKTSVKSSLEIK